MSGKALGQGPRGGVSPRCLWVVPSAPTHHHPLQLEFAVQMTCQSCVDAVRKALQGVAGKRRAFPVHLT